MDELLAALLVQRLPRGRDCTTCAAFEPDDLGGDDGTCANGVPIFGGCVGRGCRCTIWDATLASGLDCMGIPLASPASEFHEGTSA